MLCRYDWLICTGLGSFISALIDFTVVAGGRFNGDNTQQRQ